MKKPKVREKLDFLIRSFWKRKWLTLLVLTAILIFVDYYDFSLAVGWGVFSKQFKPNPIEAIVATLLLLTLYETWKSSGQAIRQTELTLRPYLRLSWDTTQVGDNRRSQGITDTCVVVSNNGHGLMRQVKYNVEVDSKRVSVRNHTLIVPNSSTNMVYDDINNKSGTALGCRNDGDFDNKNNDIIRKRRIKIYGSYRDVEGGRYSFSFESDPNEQSWFREKYRQQLRNRRSFEGGIPPK